MLSQEINDYDKATQEYFNEISKYKPLSKEEERALLVAYKETGDENAKMVILQSNLKFVVSVAKEFRGRGLSFADLIAEGNLGMVKALEKFDLGQDVKFISYAVWWIRQSITYALDHHNNLPAEELPRDYKYQDIEIDDEDNVDNNVGEAYFNNESNDYCGDLDKKNVLLELSKHLTGREKKVLCQYYGLDGSKPKTLEEIGKALGLTKERVRQINEKSLKKMRSMALNKSINKDIYK